jgi:hypothetical protein
LLIQGLLAEVGGAAYGAEGVAAEYEQTAHVVGGEEYRAAVPFPVTIVPSQLVIGK